jgi:DUF4097 and DUF4098 domain-containing protein YvlB
MKLGKFAFLTFIFTIVCFTISYATVPRDGEHQHPYPLSLLNSWKNIRMVKDLSGMKSVTINETIPAASIQKLQIQVESGDIVLRVTDSSDVAVSLNGQFSKQNPLEIEQRQNEIVVRVEESSIFNGDAGSLEVQVPKSITELQIATVSGQVDGDIPGVQRFNVATVSGDLKFANIKVPSLKIATVSGDVDVSGEINELNLVSVSGDINVSSINPAAVIKVNSTSGDVKVSLAAQPDTKVKFKSVSGEGKVQSANNSREITKDLTFGNGTGLVTVETISGNLLIDGSSLTF